MENYLIAVNEIRQRVGGVLANHSTRRLTISELRDLTGLTEIEVLAGLFSLLQTGNINQRRPFGRHIDYTYSVKRKGVSCADLTEPELFQP